MISQKSIKHFGTALGLIFLLGFIFVPAVSYSEASKDTAAKNTGITYECGDDATAGNCDFNDLILATKKVVNFGTTFALFFSVIVISYAGFIYMTSGGNATQRGKANEMLFSVLKGIGFMLCAWLIVTLITNTLLKESVTKVVPLG